MTNAYKAEKEWLKSAAKAIRTLKDYHKKHSRSLAFGELAPKYPEGLQGECLYHLKWEFRHRHIAMSLLRGKTREQIERKVDPDNLPNEKRIKEYFDKLTAAVEAEREQTTLRPDAE